MLGFGDGTFQEIFPMYRDKTLDFISFWGKAHNSYLELVQGLGVPVALLFVAAIVLLAGRSIVAALTRRQCITAPLAASGGHGDRLSARLRRFQFADPGVRLDLGRADRRRNRVILEQQNRHRSIGKPTRQNDGRRRRFHGDERERGRSGAKKAKKE